MGDDDSLDESFGYMYLKRRGCILECHEGRSSKIWRKPKYAGKKREELKMTPSQDTSLSDRETGSGVIREQIHFSVF